MVDADADDGHAVGLLNQNARYFLACDINVIGPFDGGGLVDMAE